MLFNADEAAGLFYRTLPDKSLSYKRHKHAPMKN